MERIDSDLLEKCRALGRQSWVPDLGPIMVMPGDSRERIQKLALKMSICHISGKIVAEAMEKLLKSTVFCHAAGFGLPTSKVPGVPGATVTVFFWRRFF